MNDLAYEQLIDRLGGDDAPPPAVVDVVLAAADGAEALDRHLAGEPAPARREPAPADPAAEPARVYLEHVDVEGFRGIGPGARLPLAPGPGLTLVVGRNGSGKSSFAEGLELLLTGRNLRWEDKTKVWREGWRNLHSTGATTLAARFRVDGEATPLDLRRRWPPGAALDGGEPVQVSGPRDSWVALGWEAPLERFRPLLSYNELGTMFSSRAAALYEALSAVLGLEELDALTARLREARLERGRSTRTEKTERDALRPRLAALDDPRAAAIAAQLAKRAPDLDAVYAVVSGQAGGDDDDAQALQGLAALALPAPGDVEARLAAFAGAVAELRRQETGDAERLDALATLLGGALAFHERHGDEHTCPVCGTPEVLDAGWSLRTQAGVQELQRRSRELRDARAAAVAARRALDGLFPAATPAVLRAAADAGHPSGDAHERWDAWAQVLRADDDAVLADGPGAAAALLAAGGDARARAAAELDRRDSSWRPLRTAATAWLATARRAASDKQAVATIKAAEDWMASFTADLRRERLQPVVDAAQANWAELRHESNVQLGEVELRKEGNQRYAAFDVLVDGTDASAFGVMSQGELSALAISVFLPRAALPESPFGFMVIDDPVQSMDPAKVDGLARVLARAAEGRQVVVFTHDERLPEAVRRLAIDARIVRVQRRAQSKVEIVAGAPPSDRYLAEAFALAKTDDLPDEVRARVVPGFCRSAIEAACAARIRRQRLAAGTPHAEVEEQLLELTKLSTWLAAAFGLGVAQGREVTDQVRRLGGEDAVAAVRQANTGAHRLVAEDGLRLAERTRALVRAIEAA